MEEELFVLVVDRPLRDDDGLPRPFSSLRGLISFLRLPLSEDLAGEDALFPMITCGMLPLTSGCGVVVVGSNRGSRLDFEAGFLTVLGSFRNSSLRTRAGTASNSSRST